jgi:hypothetical protein
MKIYWRRYRERFDKEQKKAVEALREDFFPVLYLLSNTKMHLIGNL